MKTIIIILIWFIIVSCQKTVPEITLELKNPLNKNVGDTIYMHIDIYPVSYTAGIFYNANVYFSQPAEEDIYIYVDWKIKNDTITRSARLIQPFKFSTWVVSTTVKAASVTYNTTEVVIKKVICTNPNKIFIYKS